MLTGEEHIVVMYIYIHICSIN